MIPRRVVLLASLAFLVQPMDGWAHSHRAGLAGGVADAARSDLLGPALTFTLDFCSGERTTREEAARHEHHTCEVGTRGLGLVASFAHGQGEHGDVYLKQWALMGGLRYSFEGDRVRPFAQALFGFYHDNVDGDAGDGPVAGSIGAGLDFEIQDRPGGKLSGLAIRTQLDMVRVKGESKWYPQPSASLVFEFDWD